MPKNNIIIWGQVSTLDIGAWTIFIIEKNLVSIYNSNMGNIKFLLANFIDEFNQSDTNKKIELVKSFPFPKITNKKYAAYISATVEELCYRSNLSVPGWVFKKKYSLKEPFFVGGFESLKAFLIVESPLPFRRRNIFVSENVLKRV